MFYQEDLTIHVQWRLRWKKLNFKSNVYLDQVVLEKFFIILDWLTLFMQILKLISKMFHLAHKHLETNLRKVNMK